MATSGAKTYTLTTQQIIHDAFFNAGIHRVNASIPSEDYAYALRSLNELAKTWQTMGFNVWNDRRATLITQKDQQSYVLGGTSTDHATESYVETTLSVAAPSGSGTITVTSATGISNGDNIGVVKDDGFLFWTTVNGAPVGNVITLTANTDGAAAAGNAVFAYTTKITKPMEVTQVLLQQDDNNEVILTRMPRQRYFNLADKAASGSANQFYYFRRRLDGILYIWTTQSDVTQVINFTYQPYLDNFVNQADEPDFPIEWGKALTWNLASELACPFGVGNDMFSKLVNKAEYWLQMAKSNDNENSKLTFGVYN